MSHLPALIISSNKKFLSLMAMYILKMKFETLYGPVQVVAEGCFEIFADHQWLAIVRTTDYDHFWYF